MSEKAEKTEKKVKSKKKAATKPNSDYLNNLDKSRAEFLAAEASKSEPKKGKVTAAPEVKEAPKAAKPAPEALPAPKPAAPEAPKLQLVTPATAPRPQGQPLAMSQMELLRIKLASMTAQKAKVELAFVSLQRMSFIEKVDPEGKIAEFDKQLKDKMGQLQQLVKNIENIQKEVSVRLGIDLKKYAFDEETGTLHYTG